MITGVGYVLSQRQGIFDEYRWIISRLQWLLDGIVVVLLLFLICWICGESFRLIFQVLGLVTFLLTIMVFRAAQLYQPWRGANLGRLVRRVFLAWLVIVAILMMLGYVSKTSMHFSRKVLLTWMATVPVALVVLRLQVFWGLRWLRQQGRNTRTVVIAGAGDLGRRLAKNVMDTPWLGMRLLGFFDDRVTGEVHLDHQRLSGAGHPGRHDRVRAETTGRHGLSGVALAGRRPPPSRWWNPSGTPPPPSIMCRMSSFSPCSPPA